MRALIPVLFVSFVCFASAKYEGYQVWRIKPTTENQMRWLSYIEENMGEEFDFWTGVTRIPGHPVDVMVQPNSQDTLRMLLKQEKLDFDIMIDDVNTLVSNQMAEILARQEGEQSIGTRLANFDYNVYHTYEEIQEWVDYMVDKYSATLQISSFLLGNSYEGRTIQGIKIRGAGSQSTNPPAVWFEGGIHAREWVSPATVMGFTQKVDKEDRVGIHAREWVSPATVMGFTQKLIDEYEEGDPLVQRMFDNIDWYIVPSLNVDGYHHTWTQDRMWRKTRSPNKASVCKGTDPNRNWPYEWGGVGASSSPCSETYRGSQALSEVEVANVVNFLRERKAEGQDFLVFIDWHSYSQLIIAPWSYLESNARTEHYDEQMAMAAAMADAIRDTHGKRYDHGVGAEILYASSGSSKDYGYATFELGGAITNGGLGAKYSYTVELRDTGRYGFTLPENQIQPTYEEIHAAVRVIGDRVLSELGL
ncbi:carboxypeptidase B [Strongylocentrotus purpuratus]|uniref:Peptidase M14 domain-containing protein n=1 Tax=Strongylocentrotus purpuratus TaxID=7668 RepID=A0A7M7PCB3_STRPU|nr:carboxypeptidase B [Strongylocentrotus purpuratus]